MNTVTRNRSARLPRRSTLLLAASVALGVVLVLWGTDRLARWAAEDLVARNVQLATGVLETPQVEVHGGFVLLQVLEGRYERVDVVLEDLRAGPLRFERVEAELSGVHVPFHDVLTRDVDVVLLERTREVATLGYDDLNTYLAATGRPLRLTGTPDGDVVLAGTVEVLGRRLSATARAVLAAADGDLAVRPTRIETGTFLDEASELLLQQRFTLAVPLDSLPFGRDVSDVDTGENRLTVEGRGAGVVLTP